MTSLLTDDVRMRRSLIRKTIILEDKKLRQEYGILQRQDLLGALILGTSVFAILTVAFFYLNGTIPYWAAILAVAFSMSFVHEIEHDLIHDIYFKDNKWIHQSMMAIIWLTKLHSNPFWRRKLHLRHHAYSGQAEDWEERLLGLGDRVGLRRILVALLPFGQFMYFRDIEKTDPRFSARESVAANIVPIVIHTMLTLLGVASFVHPVLLGQTLGAQSVHVFQALLVLWIIPGWIRYTTLTLATNLCHYAGDITYQTVEQENQIIYHWVGIPLALFTANFAATHIIHHFYAPQPFYIRYLVAPKVIPVMIQQGCRYNDLGILRRNNRYYSNSQKHYGFSA
jgi:fatty acid desaturase